MLSPVVVISGLTALLAVFVWVFFTRARSRLLAAVCLSPLVAVAGVITHTGADGRQEATDLQSNPTVFGTGGVAGASHAAGTGEVAGKEGGASAATPAPIGLTAELVAEAAGKLPGASLGAAPEPYTPATLWNRMDGGAELYTRAGLVHAALATVTVTRGGKSVEVEVQVFDFGTTAKATALYDGVDRDPASAPIAGRHGVTWAGGGEVAEGRFYLRIVAGAAEPSPNEVALSTELLTALATAAADSDSPVAAPASSPGAARPPEAPSLPVDKPSEPATAVPVPTAPNGPAEAIGAPAHFTDIYGLGPVASHAHTGGDVLESPARSPLAAAAFTQALMPAGAKKVGRFGWSTADACMIPWGAAVLVARGAGAEARVTAVATPPRLESPPGLWAFDDSDDVEPRVAGWGGRQFLGEVLVGHMGPDGRAELIVAAPEDLDGAWTALKSGLPSARERGGILAADDPVQGPIAGAKVGRNLVLAAGFETPDAARAALDAVRKRLVPTP